MSYGFRIWNSRTGYQLSSGGGATSAREAGRMAAEANEVLDCRGIHVASAGYAVEDGVRRPVTPAEEAEMCVGFDQYIAELTEETS